MLKNMVFLIYNIYEYNNLIEFFNYTYILCFKIWDGLDLKVKSYKNLVTGYYNTTFMLDS